MIVLKNILVPTDFSEPSQAALRYGCDLARSYSARLHLLHVAPDLLSRYSVEIAPVVLPDLQRETEDAARKQVQGLLPQADVVQLQAQVKVTTSNSPATAIVEYARDGDIDLIVMGTHGRGIVTHFLMGSVAERVVRTAPCPVLTVRHPEHEFLVPDALTVASAQKA